MRCLAANERKRTLNDLDQAATFAGFRIVGELVEHHSGIAAQGERHSVDEPKPDSTVGIRCDHVILKEGCPFGRDDPRAVSPNDDDFAFQLLHVADGLLFSCVRAG